MAYLSTTTKCCLCNKETISFEPFRGQQIWGYPEFINTSAGKLSGYLSFKSVTFKIYSKKELLAVLDQLSLIETFFHLPSLTWTQTNILENISIFKGNCSARSKNESQINQTKYNLSYSSYAAMKQLLHMINCILFDEYKLICKHAAHY